MPTNLDADQINTIYNEAVLGKHPSDTSPEAIAYRKQLDAEIAESRANGDKTDWKPLSIEQ